LTAYELDTNLVQLVNGWADTGEALVESADKITFIGSPEVGKLVMKHAANTLTPVILELGGKDVAVIFDDADYDQVVQVALRGTFQNSGQNCAGLERLVVQDGIYERFVGDMVKYISSLRVGPPLERDVDMGAMTMNSQIGKIQELVDDAVKKGARLLVGGKQHIDSEYPHGQYYSPTLLVDVTPSMRIAQEEVFGPVMSIMKFSSEKEAVHLANSSPYALGSSVFTLDTKRGERIAKLIRAGMCNVNDFGANYLCQGLPFGGVGISGIDRFAGVEGLRGNCNIRSATSDRFYGIRTNLPPMLRFPLTTASIKFQESLVGTLYGSSWAESLKSMANLVAVAVTGKA
jgi:aldehyde dehydrogenase (NAD+)